MKKFGGQPAIWLVAGLLALPPAFAAAAECDSGKIKVRSEMGQQAPEAEPARSLGPARQYENLGSGQSEMKRSSEWSKPADLSKPAAPAPTKKTD